MKTAEDIADVMHQTTMGMIEEAHKKFAGKGSWPGIDPEKLIAAVDRLNKIIEDQNARRAQQLEELQKKQAELRQGIEKIIEAVRVREREEQARLDKVVSIIGAFGRGAQYEIEAPRSATFRSGTGGVSIGYAGAFIPRR